MHHTIITIETDAPGEMLWRIHDIFILLDIQRIIIREFSIEISTNDRKFTVLRYLAKYHPDVKDLDAKIYIKDTFFVSLQKIKTVVESITHCKLEDKSRVRKVIEAKQTAHYLARKYTNKSFSDIGKFLGNMDHASVIHSCKAIDNLLFSDKEFRTKLINIERNLI